MITLRVWFVMIFIGAFLAGSTLWTVVRPVSTFALPLPSTAIVDPPDTSMPDADEPRIDLYGNEIQDAVGDYRIDFRGAVYENHSPDTAVIHLAPPTT